MTKTKNFVKKSADLMDYGRGTVARRELLCDRSVTSIHCPFFDSKHHLTLQ